MPSYIRKLSVLVIMGTALVVLPKGAPAVQTPGCPSCPTRQCQGQPTFQCCCAFDRGVWHDALGICGAYAPCP